MILVTFVTNRCVRVMEFLDVMVSKCDLAKQSIEFWHSLSLETGIFQRALTSARIDLCQQFCRF